MGALKKEPTLRFPEFEGEWEVTSMGKVANIKKGFTPKTDNKLYWNNGVIPWLSIADMNQGKYINSSTKKITKEALGEKKLTPVGTLIMSFKLSIGKLAILNEEMMTNEAICHFYWKNNTIITEYAYYYLNTINIASFGGRAVKGVTLNGDSLNSIVIKLPPLPEQEKIAACLSVMDEKIEGQQQTIEYLQAYKKGLLQQLFSQTLRFPGFEGAWEEKKLGEMGDTYTGLNGKTKENFGHGDGMFVTYMNVFSNTFSSLDQLDRVDISNDEKQNTLKKGDILFTTSSETPHEVGMSSCWNHDLENVYLNSFCFGYRLNKKEDYSPEFIAYNLRNSKIRKRISILAQGSTRFNLSKTELMKMAIKLPSLSEQQKIADCLSLLDEKIELETQKLEKLQTYKKGLLQQLFV